MDATRSYQSIIEQVFTPYVEITYSSGDIHNELIIEREHGRSVIMSMGWQGARRIHGCLVPIDRQDGKVWIQRDGTKHGIANDLVASGIPRDAMVLGWYRSSTRQHTDDAAAS